MKTEQGQRLRGLDRERLVIEARRAATPFLVLMGFVALSVAALLVILHNNGVNPPWQHSYETRVALADASGVAPGADDVRLKGVNVGKIKAIKLVDGHPIATIGMERKYGPLYRDAQLRLRPATPLQDLYLDIENRGHPAAGRLGKDDVLPVQQTHQFVNINSLLNVFDADRRTRVRQTIDELGRALPDHGQDLRATLVQLTPFLRSAKQLMQVTADRSGQTARLMHNFRLMTEELAHRDAQVRTLVRGGAESLGAVGGREASLAQLISEMPPMMRQLEGSFTTLRAAADQLDPAFDALQPTARAMPSGLRALGRFGTSAAPAFRALRRPLPSLDALVHAARPTANRLAAAFARLQPAAPRLDRITGLMTPCEPALQKFFTNTISLTKFYDRRAPWLRAITVLAGGASPQPNQTPVTSCAPGGPRG